MTDPFRGVMPFVAVAETLSFTAAARRLGLTTAAVSKAVLRLEQELGVTLLARSSRVVALTEAGERFSAACRTAVGLVTEARDAAESSRNAPRGTVVLSVPAVAAGLVMPAVARIRGRHAQLRCQVRVSDQLARLTDDRVDVALRIGHLADSALVARRLGPTRLVTVASPAYLARRGTPRQLEELGRHECLTVLGPSGKPRAWLFATGPRAVEAGMVVDHGPALVHAAVAGVGIVQLFDFMARPLLAAGQVVELFADLAVAGPDMFAVCTAARRSAPNVRAVIDALAESVG